MIKYSLLAFLLLFCTARTIAQQNSTTRQWKHPDMFIDSTEIESIKSMVVAEKEPWLTAYKTLIKDAGKALKSPAFSVVNQGPTTGNSINEYLTERPYCGWDPAISPCGKECCDGQKNPDSDRSDYEAAIKFGKAVRDLGLAYAFTGDKKYADKALGLIKTWTIDPNTRMAPKFTISQSFIELYISIPGMFYGADLIWNYKGWSPADKTAFIKWTKDITLEAAGKRHKNNFENWRVAFVMAGAALLEDENLMNVAIRHFKDNIAKQVRPDGAMIHEIGRTNSLDYSLYAVLAMVQAAETVRHYGEDLYHYKSSDQHGLELILDYHAPYASGMAQWPYQQIKGYKGDNTWVYEFGYSIFQKPVYKAVLDHWGRPMYDERNMGPVSLTHGYDANITTKK